jgi:hypothetical protein
MDPNRLSGAHTGDSRLPTHATETYARIAPTIMSESSYVLCYSRDALLVDARKRVLESAGFHVLTAVEFGPLQELAERFPISLMILGHTLSPAQCDAALHFAHSRRPPIPCLVLQHSSSQACPLGPLDSSMEILDGPEALIANVQRGSRLGFPICALG